MPKAEHPGFTRVSFPYFWDELTVDYVIAAVRFVARHAWRLQDLYLFDGERYVHKEEKPEVFAKTTGESLVQASWYEEPALDKRMVYASYLTEAKNIVQQLKYQNQS